MEKYKTSHGIVISAEGIADSLRTLNVFRKDIDRVNSYMHLYGAAPYGLPFKYQDQDDNNVASALAYLSGVMLHHKFNGNVVIPKHFQISLSPDIARKKGSLIKELLLEHCEWGKRTGQKDFGSGIDSDSFSFNDDGSISVEKDALKDIISSAVGKNKKENSIESSSPIDLLKLPCCRRVLFLAAVAQENNRDISIEYKMLDNFLKNYCKSSLIDIREEMLGAIGDDCNLEGAITALNLDGQDPSLDYCTVFRSQFFNCAADCTVFARLAYREVMRVITTLPKKFESYLSLMECLFSIATLSGTSLVLRNFMYEYLKLEGSDRDTAILISECIDAYFAPITFAYDAQKGYLDPAAMHAEACKRFGCSGHKEVIKKAKKQLSRGGFDNIQIEAIKGLLESVNQDNSLIAAEPYGRTTEGMIIRASCIISSYRETKLLANDIKKFFTDDSRSLTDIFNIWASAKNSLTTIDSISSCLNSTVFAFDLMAFLVEVLVVSEMRVSGMEGCPIAAIEANKNGLTKNALLALKKYIPTIDLLSEADNRANSSVVAHATGHISSILANLVNEVENIAESGKRLSKLSKRFNEINLAEDFNPEEYKSVTEEIFELRTAGNNPKAKLDSVLPAFLTNIDKEIEYLIDDHETGESEDLKKSREEVKKLINETHALDTKIFELSEKIEGLTLKNQSLASTNKGLESKVQSGEGTKEIPEEVISFLSGTPMVNVADALVIAKYTLGDRVKILPSAMASAEDSEYSQPDRVLREITVLATSFITEIQGKGTEAGRKLFPTNVYRAGESETVCKDEKLVAYRKFPYQGEKQLFTAHLALGSSYSKTKHCRVYFRPEIENNRVVIAYCGKHLPSKNNKS